MKIKLWTHYYFGYRVKFKEKIKKKQNKQKEIDGVNSQAQSKKI